MRVLIVEDDMVIAGGLGPLITEIGHDLVGLAADRATAAALLASTDIDLALVDLRLLDGWTGVDVALAAEENGVAVVFATANPGALPDGLAGALGVIEKPYRPEGMKAALRYVAAHLAGHAVGAPPRCLTLATRAAPGTTAVASAARPGVAN